MHKWSGEYIVPRCFTQVSWCTFHRLPWESHHVKQKFFNEWVDAHIKDADEILKKPVIFSEFALYDHEHRDALYKSIYEKVHASAVKRGAAGGAIAWQLLDEQMAHVWNDGFAVFPAQDFSVIDLMKQQSCRLKTISTGIDKDHRVCGEPPAKSWPQPVPQRPFEVILAEHQQSMAP
jgi:mannan endo-1,4-beta-mannosidase